MSSKRSSPHGDYTINNPKRIFVTISTYNGDLGGISGADNKCDDGNKPATGTYKAFIVDGAGTRRACTTANCSGGTSEHADWVLKPNTNYVRAVGATALFTTNANGIFVDNLSNPISGIAQTYWTGMNNDFTTATRHCVSWTEVDSSASGNIGDANTISKESVIRTGDKDCNLMEHILCVEQ